MLVMNASMSEGLALGRLATKQERLWVRAVAADLEGTEVLKPVTLRHFRLRVNPEAELIEVGDADGAVAHPVDQVLTDVWRQIAPTLDLGH